MAIRKSKEKKLQVQDTLENVREKSMSALNQGGFKKIENNGLMMFRNQQLRI